MPTGCHGLVGKVGPGPDEQNLILGAGGQVRPVTGGHHGLGAGGQDLILGAGGQATPATGGHICILGLTGHTGRLGATGQIPTIGGHSAAAAATSPALRPVLWPMTALGSRGVMVSDPSMEKAFRG